MPCKSCFLGAIKAPANAGAERKPATKGAEAPMPHSRPEPYRKASCTALLRRRAVHEAFRYGSGREWGIGASAPFVAGFLSAPAFAGALIAPKKHDLQGIASRAFLHVAAVHPSRCEGERYFLSGSDRAAVLPGLCQNSSFLRPEGSPLTRCLQAILIQSSDPAFCRAMNP